MIDKKTPNYQIPLPNPANLLLEDVARLQSALVLIDQLLKTQAQSALETQNLQASQLRELEKKTRKNKLLAMAGL